MQRKRGTVQGSTRPRVCCTAFVTFFSHLTQPIFIVGNLHDHVINYKCVHYTPLPLGNFWQWPKSRFWHRWNGEFPSENNDKSRARGASLAGRRLGPGSYSTENHQGIHHFRGRLPVEVPPELPGWLCHRQQGWAQQVGLPTRIRNPCWI